MKNIPTLRFSEFLDDGEWEKIKLGELVTISSGVSPSKYDLKTSGEYPFLKVEDLNNCVKYQVSSREYSHDKKNIIKKESIIFPKRGAAILLNKVRINISDVLMDTNLMAITPNEKIDSEFLYYTIDKVELSKIADTSTIPQINNKHILPFAIDIPKPKEQQKIADCLSSIDNLVTAQSKKVETLKEHKKALMQQLFPRNGEKVPKLRFPEFENDGEWEEKQLSELLTIGNGKDYKHLNSGKIPVYGTGGYMLSVDDYLYDGESVCIGRKGTIDKPMFLTGKFWTVDTLFYTHSFKNCIPKYIFYNFGTINWYDNNEAGGVPSLSKATINKINIPVPPKDDIKEQQKIANFLSSIDELITSSTKKVETLKEHKKGLTQQLFPSAKES